MTHDQAIERVNKAMETMKDYAGTDASLAAVRLLQAMAELYRHELVNVAPSDIAFRQAAAKQVMALENVFAGDANADARI